MTLLNCKVGLLAGLLYYPSSLARGEARRIRLAPPAPVNARNARDQQLRLSTLEQFVNLYLNVPICKIPTFSSIKAQPSKPPTVSNRLKPRRREQLGDCKGRLAFRTLLSIPDGKLPDFRRLGLSVPAFWV